MNVGDVLRSKFLKYLAFTSKVCFFKGLLVGFLMSSSLRSGDGLVACC